MFIKMPAFAGIFLQKRIEIPGKNEPKKAGKKFTFAIKKYLQKRDLTCIIFWQK